MAEVSTKIHTHTIMVFETESSVKGRERWDETGVTEHNAEEEVFMEKVLMRDAGILNKCRKRILPSSCSHMHAHLIGCRYVLSTIFYALLFQS